MTLNDVVGNYFLNGAIFKKMCDMFEDVPFKDDVELITLDIDFMSLYGQRLISPLVKNYITLNFDYVVDENEYYVYTPKGGKAFYLKNDVYTVLGGLATIIHQRYIKQWKRLYDTMKVEYNPIHNYDMNEEEKISSKVTTTDTGTNTGTGKTTNKGTNENNIFGFNSTEAVGDNEQIVDNEQNQNVSSTINNTNVREADLDDNVRKLERKGNIGVTTSQKMLKDERDVWKYDFFKEIFRQTALLITSPIYK